MGIHILIFFSLFFYGLEFLVLRSNIIIIKGTKNVWFDLSGPFNLKIILGHFEELTFDYVRKNMY